MFEVENAHWWYKSLRDRLVDVLTKQCAPGARVLDVGCGTGANLDLLRSLGYDSLGIDLSPIAVDFCRRRGHRGCAVADSSLLPFRDASMDAVVCCDMFECAEVDERRAFSEIVRVTRPGGAIILTVAAFQWLLSEHDRAVHSVRRYTAGRARSSFSDRRVEMLDLRYLFPVFFPMIAARRLLSKAVSALFPAPVPRSDVVLPSRWLNQVLEGLSIVDSVLSSILRFPFGSTVFILLRKTA